MSVEINNRDARDVCIVLHTISYSMRLVIIVYTAVYDKRNSNVG